MELKSEWQTEKSNFQANLLSFLQKKGPLQLMEKMDRLVIFKSKKHEKEILASPSVLPEIQVSEILFLFFLLKILT